ncbi:ABC transporter permease [Solirubrobacter soli]|uniref:ABC transporter permease n=1 Tax=Solirubrobacter soli TaxID=363832 RepID=UPI000400CE40|nr:ABC transporter permease subunit [Solirubrobacter soli]
MIWLTWRQGRSQTLVVAGGAAALLAFLALAAGSMPDFTDDFIRVFAADQFLVTVYTIATMLVLCLPAIIGIFWGAPLVARELEAGTHRLVWNQSVTRTRWLATKLLVTGGAALLIVAVLSLALTWWAGSLDDAVNAGQNNPGMLGQPRIASPMFDTRGLAPIGYTAFAFTLGVAAGTVVRRTVPAMAITLAVFVVVQILTPSLVREHLGPSSTLSTITADNLVGLMIQGDPSVGPLGPVKEIQIEVDEPGAWVIANQTLDRTGKVQDELPSWFAGCVPGKAVEAGFGPPPGIPQGRSEACFKRAAAEGYKQRVTFMPASKYWTLQATETAIFLALAGLLAAGTFWWLRVRIA